MIDTISLERAIIGCILMNGKLFIPLKGELRQDEFSDEICKTIYGAMTLLEYRGMSIDPVMVITQLSRNKDNDIHEADIYALANAAPNEELFSEYVLELGEIRGEEFEEQNK